MDLGTSLWPSGWGPVHYRIGHYYSSKWISGEQHRHSDHSRRLKKDDECKALSETLPFCLLSFSKATDRIDLLNPLVFITPLALTIYYLLLFIIFYVYLCYLPHKIYKFSRGWEFVFFLFPFSCACVIM